MPHRSHYTTSAGTDVESSDDEPDNKHFYPWYRKTKMKKNGSIWKRYRQRVSASKKKNKLNSIEKKLRVDGVATFSVVDNPDFWREIILKDLKHTPELKAPFMPSSMVVTLGGFGALGTPSSFHFQSVRDLREVYLRRALEVPFKHTASKNIAPLVDRLCIRLKGQAPGEETPHRDQSPAEDSTGQSTGTVYGGWVNLSDVDQTFSCFPKNQLKGSQGFRQLSEEERIALPPPTPVNIPPGHAVIFDQTLAHEVLATPASTNAYMKLFMGFRTCDSPSPLFPEVDSSKKELHKREDVPLFGLPTIPSGQKPPMYSSNHGSNFLYKPFSVNPKMKPKSDILKIGSLIEWSKQFRNDLLETKIHGRTKEKYDIIPRYLTRKVNAAAYGEVERQIYLGIPKSRRQWMDLLR